jgi:hypothetical protein
MHNLCIIYQLRYLRSPWTPTNCRSNWGNRISGSMKILLTISVKILLTMLLKILLTVHLKILLTTSVKKVLDIYRLPTR